MTQDDIVGIMGTRFLAQDGTVILFLRSDPPAVIIPDGVPVYEAAKEFVRIVNEMLLPKVQP